MKKEINIKVIGTHQSVHEGDDREIIEHVYPATYIQKDGCHYLFYEEIQEGFGPVQNKVITHPGGHLRMTKKGVINSDMEFHLGESRTCEYKTPLLTAEISFHTEHLHMEVTEDQLTIVLTYLMDLNGETHSRSTVEIHSTT